MHFVRTKPVLLNRGSGGCKPLTQMRQLWGVGGSNFESLESITCTTSTMGPFSMTNPQYITEKKADFGHIFTMMLSGETLMRGCR